MNNISFSTPANWPGKRSFLRRVLGRIWISMSPVIDNTEFFLKIYIRILLGRKLNLENPERWSDKLQWLKCQPLNKDFTKMVDKYEVRDYIKNKIGENFLIPLLGVWDNANDIDFDSLPESFVLKTTHDSAGIYICKSKHSLNGNYTFIRKKLNKHLKYNYYYKSRETPYKEVKPRIIAEKFMVDKENGELKDYKFWCFNGDVKFVGVDSGRFTDHHYRNFYDKNWKQVPIALTFPTNPKLDLCPECIDKMFEIAAKLSQGIPFLRVDLYYINKKIYFGELTFYPDGGIERMYPEKWDFELGKYVDLSCIK